jgi:hypothetical protein
MTCPVRIADHLTIGWLAVSSTLPTVSEPCRPGMGEPMLFVGDDWVDRDPSEVAGLVKVGIETDRGSWVGSLVAAGDEVHAINPMSVARYRERHSTSGVKSDAADAHLC